MAKYRFTAKITRTFTLDIGKLPLDLIESLIREAGDGQQITPDYSIYDFISTTVDDQLDDLTVEAE